MNVVDLNVVLCTFLIFTVNTRGDCIVSINNDLGNPQPLLLKADTSTVDAAEAYWFPVYKDEIYFNDNDTVTVECTGSGNSIILNGTDSKISKVTLTCSKGLFIYDTKKVQFKEIKCKNKINNIAKYNNKNCLGSYKEIIIGYQTTDRFIEHMTICFDAENEIALYSKAILSHSIEGYQFGTKSPNFVQDSFYTTKNVDALYKKEVQRTTINRLLGISNSTSTKYIHDTTDYFLSRGHLSAKTDHIYASHQEATFHFVNAAPQWQTLNGRNWNTLEKDIRNYVSATKQNHEIYTGTFKTLTLTHEQTRESVPIYLNAEDSTRLIPAPELFWKILYNPESKSGTAFVSVNNPYLENISSKIYCTDICQMLDWLSWDQYNVAAGFSYCCEVNELRQVIWNIPEIDVESILV